MNAPSPSAARPDSTSPGGFLATPAQRWGVVILLGLASLINYLDRSILSFALPSISNTLGLGDTAKGVLLSAFFWSYALMQIPMGLLSDRVDLRWLYAAAFALWSLAQGFTGLASGFAMLILFRVLLGVGEAIYLPGGTKIVSVLFAPSERGFPNGLFDSGTRAGMCLGGLLVPLCLKQFGWRATFAVVGFSALFWLVPWLAVAPARMRTSAEAPKPTAQPSAPAATNPRQARDLFGICLGFFCFDYYWYLLVTWLPDYLVNSRHLGIIKAGIYASAPYLVFAFCQPVGGWIADRLVRAGFDETRARKGIISFAFLTGLFLLPAAWASSANSALWFLMASCLVGLSTANQLAVLQSCAPHGQIGFWTGIYNFIGNIAGVLAPLITGALITWTHSYTPGFVLAGVLIALGQLSYWFLVGKVGATRLDSNLRPS